VDHVSTQTQRGAAPTRTTALVAIAALASAAIALSVRTMVSRGALETDTFRFLAPEALFLLATIPGALLLALRSKADLSRTGFVLGTLLRASLAAALFVALARPTLRTDATLTSTVVLVDVSPSVSDASIARARTLTRALLAARGEAGSETHHVEIVTFARHAERVAVPEDPQALELDRLEGTDSATDLASALRFAEALFLPGRLPRLWVLSDGLETRGQALAMVPELASHGVRVMVTPYEGAIASELTVTGLSFPEEIRAGQPFEVRVSVRATADARARVRLYQDDRLVGLDGVQEVELHAGDDEVSFRTVARERGTVELRAELEPLAPEASAAGGSDATSVDRFAENNRFVRAADVIGRPRVLVACPEPARMDPFARVLDAAEIDADVRGPRGIPTSPGELAGFDAIVLADTPADQVSASLESALDAYVRRGGTLLFAGGPRAFGPGGWRGTQLERIMPVSLEGERRRDTPALALALVIDRSGSMAGEKMELAKEAARATADVLSPDDFLEVIGFDTVAERTVPLQSASNRLAIQRDIGRLAPRGGTAIFPALDAAYQDLAGSRAATRHVILLTDGQTSEPGIPELVASMRADGITVTSVGVGTDVNRTLLSEVADLGGGRAYFTADPSSIPRIFLREATTVGQNSIVEDHVRGEVVTNARFLRGLDMARAPLVRGYVATQARGAPSELVLRTELGDPLLARRAVGGGHTIAWTSDLAGRWSADFLRWPLSPRFFGQLLREHARSDESSFLPLATRIEDDALVISADAFDENDQFLHDVSVHARIEGPIDAPEAERETREIDLAPIAPGRLEARVPLTRYGAYAVDAVHAIAGVPYGVSRASPNHPYPAEYARLTPDPSLLDALAARTGGARIDEDPRPLFEHDEAERIEAHEEIAPRILAIALALLVLDVLVRRLLRAT
jgi:Ca-activated chloride channel family protein